VIRVVIADDSRVFRAVLRAILEAAPELEVVGEAVDGDEAVARVLTLRPDVVTMDVRMPGRDGIAAVEAIMARAPTPVVMVSGVGGPEHQAIGFRALEAGAVEVLQKPSSGEPGRFEREAETIRLAVRAVAGLKLVTRHPRRPGGPALTPPPSLLARPLAATWVAPWPSASPRPPAPPPVAPLPQRAPASAPVQGLASSSRPPVRAVGLVASTGGPPALARILAAMPGRFAAPILVVQHIATGFEAGLVHWLARGTALAVKLAVHGEPLRPGTVYLAPEGRHLTALAGSAFLDDGPPVRGFKPSGTALLRSLAREYGAGAVGAVLTGMGDDGVDGLRALRDRGGATLAQGPATSVVYGMPREAAERGAAAEVLEVDDLAAALVQLGRGGRD